MGLLKKIKKVGKKFAGPIGAAAGFAIGGPTGAKIGASLGGALASGSGSKKAGKKAAKAEERAAALMAQQYQQIRADAQPFYDSGVKANTARNALMGLDGGDPTASLYASPDYQFRRDEGMRGIERSAAARGGAFSGNALRALTDFNSNLASDEFNNRFARLSSIVNGGQNALGVTAGSGMQSAGYQGNAIANAGAARASGIAGQYNALGQGVQDIFSIFGENAGSATKSPDVPRYPWDERLPARQTVKYDAYGRPVTRMIV